jgi:hypothetical protein
VLLPLPEGLDYREYANRQHARFPGGALRVQGDGGTVFLAGLLPDLHYLFPKTRGWN